jgi:hypothetical protein
MTTDLVAEILETAIAALEKGEDVLLQGDDLVWLRQILCERAADERPMTPTGAVSTEDRILSQQELKNAWALLHGNAHVQGDIAGHIRALQSELTLEQQNHAATLREVTRLQHEIDYLRAHYREQRTTAMAKYLTVGELKRLCEMHKIRDDSLIKIAVLDDGEEETEVFWALSEPVTWAVDHGGPEGSFSANYVRLFGERDVQ